jgi:2,4-dienoyl-CoA reductase-like NADH-dependent reductase (Old Yellow Enzyme family)
LLARIERYLKRTRTAATRFGREAARDPKLVHDMRNGRFLRPQTARRVAAYLARAEAEGGA